MHGVRHRRDEIGAFQGRAPFGFRRSPEQLQLEVDPDTAPIARALIARFIETADARGCCKWLVEEHKLKMSAKGLKHWLLNPALVGDTGRSLAKTYTEKGTRAAIAPGQYLRVDPDTHPPLISRTTWAAAKVALDRSRRTPGAQRRGGSKPQWFSSRFICCECGNRMNQNGSHIRCTNAICGSRYSNGSITRDEAKAMVKPALEMIGIELAHRMAPLLTTSADASTDSPELKVLLDQIATLESTGLDDVAPVIARLQGQVDSIKRQTRGFRDNEAEQLKKLLQMIGTPEAVASISDDDLLSVMVTADIQVVVHEQMPAWVLANRWESNRIAWYLTKRGTMAVVSTAEASGRIEEAIHALPSAPASERVELTPDGGDPLVPQGSWEKPRRMRVGN